MDKDNENHFVPLEELPLEQQIMRRYGFDPSRKDLFTPSWQRKNDSSDAVLTSGDIARYIEKVNKREENKKTKKRKKR